MCIEFSYVAKYDHLLVVTDRSTCVNDSISNAVSKVKSFDRIVCPHSLLLSSSFFRVGSVQNSLFKSDHCPMHFDMKRSVCSRLFAKLKGLPYIPAQIRAFPAS